MIASRRCAMPLAVLALLLMGVIAIPQVNLPLNQQFPPVARVGIPYSFQFAPTTFQPDYNKLQYSLVGAPSWLRLNGSNRTLLGTPGPRDTGMATFTITAAGEAGAVANMESKLLVKEQQGPKMSAKLSQTLSQAGQLCGPNTITLLPTKPFEVVFTSDTFQASDKDLRYYATLSDHTPLPAWISFNGESMRFSGTTPPIITAQSIDIALIALEDPEFAAAAVDFTILISHHQLLFKPLTQTITLSKGEEVNISDLKSKLFLDGVPIQDSAIQSAKGDYPSWVTFNNHTFEVNGMPPTALMSQDVTVQVVDTFGDSAEHTIHFVFTSKLFTAEVGQLNVSLGRPFEYKIPKSLLTYENETVTADLGELGEWLQFDEDALSIDGTVPESVEPHSVECSITATSHDGTLTDTQTFLVLLSTNGAYLGPANTSSSSGASDRDAENKDSNTKTMSSRKRAGIIIGSVVSALFAVLILLSFICLLCRRKGKTDGYISPKTPRSPRKTDISRPIPIQEEWRDMDAPHDVDLEKGKIEGKLTPTLEHPPQLALDLAIKRKDSHSPTSSINENEDRTLSEHNRSSWGLMMEAGPSHHPHHSMKEPTRMLRGESVGSPDAHRQQKVPVYRDSRRRSSGLPLNRRVPGLGHGRHMRSSSRSTNILPKFRRRISSSSYTTATNSMSMLSTGPSAFPQLPTARHTTQLTNPVEKRHSIRVVAASTCESLLDCRTLDEKRSSYIRKRASAQREVPFFAGSSRLSSPCYKMAPAFMSDSSPIMTPLAPLSSNIVRPGDDISSEHRTIEELPDSLRICKPADTPSPTGNRKFPGSLRKTNRPTNLQYRNADPHCLTQHGASADTTKRPGTTIYQSDRILPSLQSDINEVIRNYSESEYSDIEEEENCRQTIKFGPPVLPPLNISPKRTKRCSKHAGTVELKRTSEREPTPYAIEHGGKENLSSTFILSDAPGFITPSVRATTGVPSQSKAHARKKSTTSPERPKTAIAPRPRHHFRTHSRPSTSRHSSGDPSNPVTLDRHSRKSVHSLTGLNQSRKRSHSRTQSSAFPHMNRRSRRGSSLTKPGKDEHTPHDDTATSERLERASLAQRTSAHRVVKASSNATAGNSKLAFHLTQQNSPFYHSKRNTAIHHELSSLSSSSPPPPPQHQTFSVGLGLSFTDEATRGVSDDLASSSANWVFAPNGTTARESAVDVDSTARAPTQTKEKESGRRIRARTPLSVLNVGNGVGTESARLVEGRGKRPVSVEVEEDVGGRAKSGWGSLRAVWGRSGSVYGGAEGLWRSGDKAFM